MISFDIIEKLIAASDARPVTVNAEACLNAKHKDRACAKCLGCPTDAITLVEGTRVELNAQRCIECGLCAAVCPTRAFTASGANDGTLLDGVASDARIEFACPRATTTRTQNIARVTPVNCLARLSSDLLVALAAEHESIWLNDAPCSKCPIDERTHPHIVALIDAAERLLAAWKRTDVLRLYSVAESQLIEPRAITRGAQSVAALSRRELFSFLRGNLGRAAGLVVAASMGNQPKPASAHVKPVDRALTKLGAAHDEHIATERFATIAVAASCTACGLCAKICPANAIEFRSDGGYFVLGFFARRCLGVDCGLCQLICPVDAIELTPGVAAHALSAPATQTLRSGALTLCNKCYTPFALEPGMLTCPMCRAAEAKRNTLLNDLFKKKFAADNRD